MHVMSLQQIICFYGLGMSVIFLLLNWQEDKAKQISGDFLPYSFYGATFRTGHCVPAGRRFVLVLALSKTTLSSAETASSLETPWHALHVWEPYGQQIN